MNWYIVLALAVPFLFVVGVVYSALKEQKVLEDGQLKQILKERHAKGLINKRGAYDDEDDYGVPERQDRKHSAAASSAEQAAPVSAGQTLTEQTSVTQTAETQTSSVQALPEQTPATQTYAVQASATTVDAARESALQKSTAQEQVAAPKRHEPLGNTEARDAASYFAKYYK